MVVRFPVERPGPFTSSDLLGARLGPAGQQPLGVMRPVVGSVFAPQMQPQPPTQSPAHLYELGLTTAAMSYHTAAIEALRDCVTAAPDHALAWRKLSQLHKLGKEDIEAQGAEREAQRAQPAAGKWKPATDPRSREQLKDAEDKLIASLKTKGPEEIAAILRERLVKDPLDAATIRLLAGIEVHEKDIYTAMRLLERALELAPRFVQARDDYAAILTEEGSYTAAAVQTALLLEAEPHNTRYRTLHAHATMHIGNYDTALGLLTELLREFPADAGVWLLYAQGLRFLGRYDESVQALRRCLDLKPDMGEAYWGLADLKGNFLTEDDIAAMRGLLAGDTLDPNTRAHMLYALGQGLERAKDFAGSFAAYEEGADLFYATVKERGLVSTTGLEENIPDSARLLRRMKQVFSKRNLEKKLKRAPPSSADRGTPLFVVGMPRAGSTLVEQILSSHSLVEGTRELPLIGDITRALSLSRMLVTPDAYPECLLDMSSEQLAALGNEYLERARDYRKTDRPYFVDKRPWNWLQVGLIHQILPQAKIIDVRREAMAAGFAMFKQLLPIEASFSYNLDALGSYYTRYVDLMDHWQSVLPGRVHFLQYEKLVDDTETEIRRLLDYCELPFEESCLRYWETDRAVATPSAEQVRQPIFRGALEQWRNFEPWLGPLKDALARPAGV